MLCESTAAGDSVVLPQFTRVATENEAAVRRAVCGLLRPSGSGTHLVNRRRDRRYPYPQPLRLTPVDRSGAEELGPAIVVLGKNLSERGIDFYHREPIPHRFVRIGFEQADGAPLEMLLDLTWCRYTRHGLYENGGRFLRVLTVER